MEPSRLCGALNWYGMGHHLMLRAIATKLNNSNLAGQNALAWFPNKPSAYPDLHLDMHKLSLEADIPWQGSKFTGNLDDFMKAAKEAYKDIDAKGVLKFPGKNGRILQKNLTPL